MVRSAHLIGQTASSCCSCLSSSLSGVWSEPPCALQEICCLFPSPHFTDDKNEARRDLPKAPSKSAAKPGLELRSSKVRSGALSIYSWNLNNESFNFIWIWIHMWIVSKWMDMKTPGSSEHMETESGSQYSLRTHHSLATNVITEMGR